MKFKEFAEWCNDRCCDGRWGLDTAIICAQECSRIYSFPKRKQEEEFQKSAKEYDIVNCINKVNEKYGIPTRYSEEPEPVKEKEKGFFKRLFKRNK